MVFSKQGIPKKRSVLAKKQKKKVLLSLMVSCMVHDVNCSTSASLLTSQHQPLPPPPPRVDQQPPPPRKNEGKQEGTILPPPPPRDLKQRDDSKESTAENDAIDKIHNVVPPPTRTSVLTENEVTDSPPPHQKEDPKPVLERPPPPRVLSKSQELHREEQQQQQVRQQRPPAIVQQRGPPPQLQQQRPQQHHERVRMNNQQQYPRPGLESAAPLQQQRAQQQRMQQHSHPGWTARPRQQQPPKWKSIWNRVERGLDDLANLEDVVAHRAKRMLNPNVVAHGAKRILHVSSAAVSKSVSSSSRGRSTKNSQQKRVGKEQAPNTKNWEDLISSKKRVIIHANGGASNPQNDQVVNSSNTTSAKLGYRSLAETNTKDDATAQPKRPLPEWRPSSTVPPQSSYQKKETLKEYSRHDASRQFEIGKVQRDDTIAPAATAHLSSASSSSVSDEGSLSGRLLSKVVGIMVSPKRLFKRQNSLQFMDAWQDKDDMEKLSGEKGWRARFSRNKKSVFATTSNEKHPRRNVGHGTSSSSSSSLTPPLRDLLARCDNGKTNSLLSTHDKRTCRSIGRSRAVMDVACLGWILAGIHEMMPYLAELDFSRLLSDSTGLQSALRSVLVDSWSPILFAAAILTLMTNSVVFLPKIQSAASSAGETTHGLARYSQLYLRLVSSLPVHPRVSEWFQWVASAQVTETVESVRLQSFVTLVLALLFVATVSVVRPVVVATVGAAGQLVTLSQWREWPVPWSQLKEETQRIAKVLSETLRSLLGTEAGSVMEHPKRFAFKASIVAALLIVARLPTVARRRKTFESAVDHTDDEEEEVANLSWLTSSTANLSNLGVSSASRLSLQAKTGAVEGTLERWRVMLPRSDVEFHGPSFKSLMKLLGYAISTGVILGMPVFLYLFLSLSKASPTAAYGWDSMATDLSILLLFSWALVWNALTSLLDASDARPAVNAFLNILSSTIAEISHLQHSPQVDMQLAALVSPSKGIAASDLWAAHTTKRAWAVRGTNLLCRNGEVLVLLGGDGAGKTRLLTTLAEAMLFPPKKSQSTTRVRGSISVGGIEVSKWDRAQLKRRLGLVLNDVRTVADMTELFSGLTLEEILEPVDNTRDVNEPHNPGTRERSAMSLALKITDLSTSLISRLPSKLSTVVTAKEEELRPSALRPRCSVLSPPDWSKVLLAKVLAQAIYDNDNQAKSQNSVERCLLGSVLILDDATLHMSETEEARLLATLRRTGAATILTSKRWSAGRLADRIAVVKDGAVVESGAHNDLMRQHSSYALEWHAMASSP